MWDYTIQPAKGSVTGCGNGIIEIGVFGHEFGHAFGITDLYDTNGGGWGVGEHALMGSGNWRNPPNPAHMSAWTKKELGWLTPTVISTAGTYALSAVEFDAEVYRIDFGFPANEYLLIEVNIL